MGGVVQPKPGTFWHLAFHSNFPTLRHVEDTEWDGFNYFEVKEGRRFIGSFPRRMRLYVRDGPGPLADQLANPMGWTIWSNRLVDYLRPIIDKHVQLLPAPIWLIDRDTPIGGYSVVNVTTTLECLDRAQSTPWYDEEDVIGDYDTPCIARSRTMGATMFKYLVAPDRPSLGVICSHIIPLSLSGKGFTGLAFIRCDSTE